MMRLAADKTKIATARTMKGETHVSQYIRLPERRDGLRVFESGSLGILTRCVRGSCNASYHRSLPATGNRYSCGEVNSCSVSC